jgi:hypothetical protein
MDSRLKIAGMTNRQCAPYNFSRRYSAQPTEGYFGRRSARRITGAGPAALGLRSARGREPTDGLATGRRNATTICHRFSAFDHFPLAISCTVHLP